MYNHKPTNHMWWLVRYMFGNTSIKSPWVLKEEVLDGHPASQHTQNSPQVGLGKFPALCPVRSRNTLLRFSQCILKKHSLRSHKTGPNSYRGFSTYKEPSCTRKSDFSFDEEAALESKMFRNYSNQTHRSLGLNIICLIVLDRKIVAFQELVHTANQLPPSVSPEQ